MKKIKVMTVFGTRPEAIKMAPIVKLLHDNRDDFEAVTVVTGQHREMLDQVLALFNIQPDYNLDIMEPQQTLASVTNKILVELGKVLTVEKPDIVLVHGDTTTTFAASLASFYQQIAIGHVEAGLRTWDKYSPFPEEMNRQLTDRLTDIYFAPTSESKHNLLLENIDDTKIFITGNTAIDALKQTVGADVTPNTSDKRMILLTMHRRENQGTAMVNVLKTILAVMQDFADLEVTVPVHPNPNVRSVMQALLGDNPRVHLIEPQDVASFHELMKASYFIMTDSGGVQEEAPFLKKPVLVLRDNTERPEGVEAGTLKLIGTEPEHVKDAMTTLLSNDFEYHKMAGAQNPYGDGDAAKRILASIQYYFDDDKHHARPEEFSVNGQQ